MNLWMVSVYSEETWYVFTFFRRPVTETVMCFRTFKPKFHFELNATTFFFKFLISNTVFSFLDMETSIFLI
jgi:hypothetical protein